MTDEEHERRAADWLGRWEAAAVRLEARSGGLARVRSDSRSSILGLGAVAVLGTVAVLVVVLATGFDLRQSTPAAGSSASTGGASPAARTETGWTVGRPSPLQPRVGAVVIWTGDRLFVWGGQRVICQSPSCNRQTIDWTNDFADGAEYDTLTDTWVSIPDAPHSIPAARGVWDGSEVVLWGAGGPLAYSPVSRAWRELPVPPIEPRRAPAAAWTGSLVVFWGGSSDIEAIAGPDDGATYDPSVDRWQTLPDAPLSPAAGLDADGALHWIDDQLVIIGKPAAVGAVVEAASLDLSTMSWRRLPDAPLSAAHAAPTSAGKEIVVLGEMQIEAGAVLDPIGATWRTMSPLPSWIRSPGAGAWTGSRLLFSGSPPASYDPSADEWASLPRFPGAGGYGADTAVWTGDRLLGWGGTDSHGTPASSVTMLVGWSIHD